MALRTEKAELQRDGYETSDAFVAALTAAWLWDKTAGLHDAAAKDPALVALTRQPVMSPAAASTLQATPRTNVADGRFFDAIVAAAGVAAASELAGIALGAWLRTDQALRINPFRDVAVMLPLRLETLFKPQPDGSWRLLLRVTPDEPSILRDEALISEAEADYLRAFWGQSSFAVLTDDMVPVDWLVSDDGVIAWAALCDRVGAPRAAWLVAQFPAQRVDSRFVCIVPPGRLGAHEEARVSGLPPKLIVTAIDRDGAMHDIGSLAPAPGDIDIVMPTDATASGNWLTDWKAAQEIGLGAEFVLPAGLAPDTIATLHVYGLGDADAAPHFAAHADAGIMGLLDLGAPTNAVEGAACADLGRDVESWRIVAINRMTGERGGGVSDVAQTLCGSDKALPDMPGGQANVRDSRLLTQALWPALWGHYYRDVWGCGDKAHDLWAWAMDNLAPEGPLPPLRFDTQPYGLLPVTAIDRWKRSGDDPVQLAEERIVEGLRQLLPQWADAAESKGTIVGADETGLLDRLGRTGVSSHYDYRTFAPADFLANLYPSVPLSDFLEMTFKAWSPAADIIGAKPAKLYAATWQAQPLDLPLIGAGRMSSIHIKELFSLLYEIKSDWFADAFFQTEKERWIVADSLLVRLMISSVVIAKAWYVQSMPGNGTSLLNPTTWLDPNRITPVERLQKTFPQAFETGGGNKPVADLVKYHRDTIIDLVSMLGEHQQSVPDLYDANQKVGALVIPAGRKAELERALRATLDTASHRIDPWATGVAWHRLREQIASGRSHHRLGAYGWLDGPFLGQPGPNESGRLHAPSYDQALTSIILRDKQLSAAHHPTADGRNIWHTELDSSVVRTALDIAQDIKLGFHIYEVVGRRVEEIVAGRDEIAALRKAKPLRLGRHDKRNVCQGMEALAALLGNGLPGVLSGDATTRAAQIERLTALDKGIDAFADLLLAEGVYNVVGGQPERAADAMDAAAGFARPPEFGVVKTPPSGYRLTTSVVSALAYRGPLTQGAPLALADASLADFLGERFGRPDQWVFHANWTHGNEDYQTDFALDEFGLTPLDAALMPHDFLAEIIRVRVGQPQARVDQAAGYRLMRQLAGTFGSHPAMSAEISGVPDAAQDAPIDAAITEELLTRYASVYTACNATIARASAPGLDVAGSIASLREMLTWGITGPADVAARRALIGVVFEGLVPEAGALGLLVASAKAALAARLAAAPDPADPAMAKMSAANLARAIGDLVAPGSKLAITARWPLAALRDRTRLTAETESALDAQWLPVMAAVRPALARIEAVQLEASLLDTFAPLAAWSSAPSGDPWRTQLVADNKTARANDVVALDMSRLVNAYGPSEAFEGADVAVALIDQFSEAVPMTKRTSYAAFGFNAPAARAPQAILLAVPPKADRRLDDDELVQILIETRRLAHVRAARVEDGATNPIAPTAWFQAAGPLRVRLDPGTEYTR